jgi:hypothetical protein
MYRSAVLQPQVDRLTCENTSTHWHSQAPDKLTRAPFATQSATHFDLANEPSYEVIDIWFDDQGGTRSLSQSMVYIRKSFAVSTPCCAGLGEQTHADGPGSGGHRPPEPFARIADYGRLMTEGSHSTALYRSSSSGLANASLCGGIRSGTGIIMVRHEQADPTQAG